MGPDFWLGMGHGSLALPLITVPDGKEFRT